jgi:nucleoside-diphosphate-sugar epimerase
MRVFVAGATGVVGRHLVPLLLDAEHEVIAAGRSAEKLERLERLGARPAAVNLFDAGALCRAIAGADAIVNLATAVPAPGPAILLRRSWRAMDRIRSEASRILVDAALAVGSVGRLVQESFAPIYDAAGDRWVDESSPVRPAAYNRSVLDAEAAAERFTRAGGTGVVLRFGFFYGPGDPTTITLIEAVRRGWFPLFGVPEAYGAWIAQEDAAGAAAAALGIPAGIYNVVDDEPRRRRELADAIARRLGVRPPRFLPAVVTRMSGQVAATVARSLRISNRKLRDASRWVPRYRDVVEGFAGVIDEIRAGEQRRLSGPARSDSAA